MKYYLIKYKYLVGKQYNLGDNIQSIAAMNTLLKTGVSKNNIDYINSEEISVAVPRDKGILIVQGWFGCRPGIEQFPIYDRDIHPLYFGFFLNEGSWQKLAGNKKFVDSMKKYEPIGCRDYGTRNFLRSIGVKAYFSGCLTLTFDKRKKSPDNGKNFFIDELPTIHDYVPEELKMNFIRLFQEGDFPSGQFPICDKDVDQIDQMAHERLELLRAQAKIVVTRRIHIAMPCTAMGIPVIFSFNQPDNPRVSTLKDILPIYDIEHFNNINWNPQVPVIDEVKERMNLIFRYRLQQEEFKMGISTKRLSGEESSKASKLLDKACREDDILKGYDVNTYTKKDFISGFFNQQQLKSLTENTQLVLFGAGSAGKRLKSILNYYDIWPACFCDNSAQKEVPQTYQRIPIVDFDTLKEKFLNCIVIIAVINYSDMIKQQLLENGFSEEKIIVKPKVIKKYAHFLVPDNMPFNQ